MNKFRLGAMLGFAAGYYLGARAGRERYAQLNRLIAKATSRGQSVGALGKARAVIDLTRERTREPADTYSSSR